MEIFGVKSMDLVYFPLKFSPKTYGLLKGGELWILPTILAGNQLGSLKFLWSMDHGEYGLGER